MLKLFHIVNLLSLGIIFLSPVVLSADPIPEDLTHKYKINLTWSGGTPVCESCSQQPWSTWKSSFACSDEDGAWNNGIKTFMDPLPASLASTFILSQVILEIDGVFDCSTSAPKPTPTTYSVSLQQAVIVNAQGPGELIPCVCRNCVNQFDANSPEYPVTGWPNYTYGGNNTISVAVTSNFLCLSTIEATLIFTRSYYSSSSNAPSDSGDPKDFSKDLIIWGFVAVGIAVGLAFAILMIYFVFKLKRRRGYVPIENPAGSGTGIFPINGLEIVLGPKIGKGSYGDVYQAEWRKIQVAVKKINLDILKNDDFMEDFTKETSIMGSLRHPNVLQFLGTCILDRDLCLVTEFMSNGSVYKILHSETFNFHWNLLKRFALDAAHGMIYLHRCEPPVIHRDLKSHNLLVDENFKLKISDFGLSRILDVKEVALTSCGTPAWAAPEVLRNQKYSAKADVYSFAICLWEFFTKLDPYEGMPTFQIIFAVGTSGLRPTIPDSCPPDYAQLIRDCWDADPDRRPDFEEIVERLKNLE